MPPEPRWIKPLIPKGPESNKLKDKLLKRLTRAGGDLFELRGDFYPLLLNHDYPNMKPEEVVKTLAVAFDTYYAGRDPSVTYLRERAEEFIDALVPDEKDAQKAKETWRIMHSETP